jgi:wobble nucleotide-excising tRNase
LQEFNELIEKINKEITEHNEKIKNKKNVKDSIKKEFWEIMRWEYNTHISGYEKDLKTLEKEEATINEALKKIQDSIKAQRDIIKENQDKTINIEKAIESITSDIDLFPVNILSKSNINLLIVDRLVVNPKDKNNPIGDEGLTPSLLFTVYIL